MKTTIKISVIAMMVMSLDIAAKTKLNNSDNEHKIASLNISVELEGAGESKLSENEDNLNVKHFNTLIGNSYVKVYQITTKSNQLASM